MMGMGTGVAEGYDLLTYEEAAQVLGVKQSAVKAAIAAGRMEPIKRPGLRNKLLRREDVEEYARSRYQRTPAAPESTEPDSAAEWAARVRGAELIAEMAPNVAASAASAVSREAFTGMLFALFGGDPRGDASAPKWRAG